MPTAKTATKPSETSTKEIQKPNGKIKLGENKKILKEDSDWHVYYDYYEEYGVDYVLNEFFSNPNGKQNWGTLINPNMYEKALKEFTRFGTLTNSTFPSKYVYQWMGIIMRNTATLEANTQLAGHSQHFPIGDVVDFAENKGIELEPTYDDCSNWLEAQGLYDWMQMPDGSDAWSDYGLSPLWEIIKEYDENLPPEEVLVLVNRALDVYHQRGDMASIFIQGGSSTHTRISENVEKMKGKKIYITESQLIRTWQIQ